MLKLKDLKGAYSCKAVFVTENYFQGVLMTAENADEIADLIREHVESQGCTDFKRDGSTVYFGNQFFNLPRIPAKREGKITFRSADYYFECPEWNDGRKSYGKKPKAADLTENGFIIQTTGGHIEYILKEKE